MTQRCDGSVTDRQSRPMVTHSVRHCASGFWGLSLPGFESHFHLRKFNFSFREIHRGEVSVHCWWPLFLPGRFRISFRPGSHPSSRTDTGLVAVIVCITLLLINNIGLESLQLPRTAISGRHIHVNVFFLQPIHISLSSRVTIESTLKLSETHRFVGKCIHMRRLYLGSSWHQGIRLIDVGGWVFV